MPYDEIEIEVLPDGRIRSENGKISPANHAGAGEFFKLLASLSGGKVERQKRKNAVVHTHNKIEQKGS